MKKIPLTQGKFALVDDEDYDALSQKKWYYHSCGYAVRDCGGTSEYMHRVILSEVLVKGQLTDHIDGDKLNNQRLNLRAAAPGCNVANIPPRRGNTSGYKGAFFIARCPKNPWLAKIVVNGRQIQLGHYPTPEQAGAAYDAAASKYWGDFALLNFPKQKHKCTST